jgi:hypothetical protein
MDWQQCRHYPVNSFKLGLEPFLFLRDIFQQWQIHIFLSDSTVFIRFTGKSMQFTEIVLPLLTHIYGKGIWRNLIALFLRQHELKQKKHSLLHKVTNCRNKWSEIGFRKFVPFFLRFLTENSAGWISPCRPIS